MGVKLVALDIDGTIVLSPATLPSERMTKAIHRLHAGGVAVVLASGRMFPGTALVARHLSITSPLICLQGATVHALSGDLLHEFALPRAHALAVSEFARENGYLHAWATPTRYAVTRDNPASRDFCRLSIVEAEYDPSPERLARDPSCVDVISTRELAPTVHRHLAQVHAGAMHFIDFPEVTVAVATDANKGHALSLICDDLGIDRHSVLAVGDSVNDASMLAWAGRGLALAHADRYALDAADDVLPDGDEPLAELLESIHI